MNAYIHRIRSKLGNEKFIHPGARIIIENQAGEFLFIERRDNGHLGVPAGSIEAGETIEACIKREVEEETGLKILQLEVIGISSNPIRETVTYPNKDEIQYFTIEFYSNKWSGTLNVQDTDEITCAKFLAPYYMTQLPPNEQSAFESLAYFQQERRIMLK